MESVVVVRGEAELFARAAHLFEAATEELACAANALRTWMGTHPTTMPERTPKKVRKLFRLSTMLEPRWAEHARIMASHGAQVRVCAHEVNETILLDGRVAIVAGDTSHGLRSYTVITRPELVHGVASLFEAAWRGGTDLAVHDAEMSELRPVVPAVLEALNEGWTDETAARALGMSLRTYRRRVADLMTALGASSRFQAGARARELGLV
ncbi:response regulator transcription factor [Actinosynnema sp. NPDC047251]|uniref:Response regulator receiver protein n=1 Tax=Saccharothrix espanaensis (strain ATCC 51144 / DSM 44229 / JCM 9112 / NBRC 15066 / NRRL 15764) TaxID=1179773 RepID=K0KAK0_SACES|nr:response regulator transcription factor [Saccharothrix espanaensis]CCH35326.1 Response regulator receiver protein [Saccharothrix espanaensis DSM 44229]